MIVGLNGYAQSGKDTAAKIISKNFGYKHVAFANKLRECLYALNPMLVYQGKNHDFATSLQEVIDEFGWDGYKNTKYSDQIRVLLQRLGTEVGRELIYEDVWVDATIKHSWKLVISDVRFPNEFNKIHALGGINIRIDRPGVGPANDHKSEVALDSFKFDYYIQNNGSIKQLEEKILNIGEWK